MTDYLEGTSAAYITYSSLFIGTTRICVGSTTLNYSGYPFNPLNKILV
uniref:Uncharacterized protein n=1 Tax=Arundo donax TaxID=35708 RepID=A0A0A9FLV2_ARUDO